MTQTTEKTCSLKPFTLIELLTVTVILAILMALLLPALSRARYTAKLAACVSNVKQINLGVTNYTNDHDTWYPSTTVVSKYAIKLDRIREIIAELEADEEGSGRYRVVYDRRQYNKGDILPGARMSSFSGFSSNSSYKALSTYYGQPYDYKGITYRNPLWQCPQGKLEKQQNDSQTAYYSMHFDHAGGATGFYYEEDDDEERANSKNPKIAKTPRNIMRKVGQVKTLAAQWRMPYGGHVDPQFRVTVSDVLHRIGHSGGGTATNHNWGGSILSNAPHYSAMKLRTWDSLSDANYAFDDGHIETRRRIRWFDIKDPHSFYISGGGGQGGDPFAYPMEFAESE